ncbi:hypothetical protein SDC9_123977 [bioreactor metagenome]|uniref:Uncharacterized protein n=1 Tax=bioreactor metagenome TaxID=1076179 RepID=A0A645CJ94_9ZZZZ
MVAVEYSGCLLRGGVGTGIGFGQRERADFFTFRHWSEVFLFLLLSAVLQDRHCGKRNMRRIHGARRETCLGHLFDAEYIAEIVAIRAAVSFRERYGEEVVFSEFFERFEREAVLLIGFRGNGSYLIFGEILHQSTNHFLLFSEIEIHYTLFLHKNFFR